MLGFVGRRLALLAATLLVASFAIYASLYIAPGSPIATLTGGRTPSPEAIAVLEERYHLNDPFLVRYWDCSPVRSPATSACRFRCARKCRT